MERRVMQDLIQWKKKENRKPILLYGARQVGKTYLAKEFGKRFFENTIYINFETNKLINSIFDDDINAQEIIKQLEIFFNKRINKDSTLIIFDEIQENPRALTSLKYFCEDANEYYVIGAGSLLGVQINRKDYSFPVGKVEILNIYPLDFEEFLINTNNSILCDNIKECYKENKKMDTLNHSKALDLFNDYIAIGGMPEVVNEYILSNSIINSIEIQTNILLSYKNDITKYASSSLGNKTIAAFNSIPNQLAKENKKFQYKVIQKGGTSSIFGESIDWLVNSGIANKCYKADVGVPLKMYEHLDSFKLYMNDVGLLTNLAEFPIHFLKNRNVSNSLMIGMLTENYVASCLKYNNINLNYWQSDFDAEIDFIIQTKKGDIIPIEVKANDNTKSRSLSVYIDKYNPPYSIRISSKNFGFENNIKSVPLYAVFCIKEDM